MLLITIMIMIIINFIDDTLGDSNDETLICIMSNE
mgnify:CR=1 FL=1